MPEGEYAYPTECMPLQQRWEVVSLLFREVVAIRAVAIFLTSDYLNSLWTAAELLSVLWIQQENDGRVPVTVYADNGTRRMSVAEWRGGDGPPSPTARQIARFEKLLNQGDPVTSAPETRIPPRGPAKLLRLLLRSTFGYYDPEFTSDHFWSIVQVPCSSCGGRTGSELDWSDVLRAAPDGPAVDCFGYFSVEPAALVSGTLTCPGCRRPVQVQAPHGVRSTWVPIQTTEADQDRQVIGENPIWEVVG